MYTRNYIISFVAGFPDTNLVAERLLKNLEDIGDTIKPYYGMQAGSNLTNLLKGHIIEAVQILTVTKAGDLTAAAASEQSSLTTQMKLLFLQVKRVRPGF